MSAGSIHTEHMKMIDAVNTATDPDQKRREELRLDGWRAGIKACGQNLGGYLIEADLEQFRRGHENRPMCCGVFLS